MYDSRLAKKISDYITKVIVVDKGDYKMDWETRIDALEVGINQTEIWNKEIMAPRKPREGRAQ